MPALSASGAKPEGQHGQRQRQPDQDRPDQAVEQAEQRRPQRRPARDRRRRTRAAARRRAAASPPRPPTPGAAATPDAARSARRSGSRSRRVAHRDDPFGSRTARSPGPAPARTTVPGERSATISANRSATPSEQLPAGPPDDRDAQRPPVDRDGEPRAQQRHRLGGRSSTHVARPEGQPPARHRQQRDVQPAARPSPEVGHVAEEVGVAGEVDRVAAAHQVTDGLAPTGPRRCRRPSWSAQVAVTCTLPTSARARRRRAPRPSPGAGAPPGRRRAGRPRGYAPGTGAARAGRCGHGAGGRAARRRPTARPPSRRRRTEVGDRASAAGRPAGAQQRVGDQPDAVQPDLDRRVTPPHDAAGARSALRHVRLLAVSTPMLAIVASRSGRASPAAGDARRVRLR